MKQSTVNMAAKLIFEDPEIDKISLRIQGTSMQPFLVNGRDTVHLKRAKHYKKGDIVVFRYKGKYIIHRITKINGNRFDALGDNLGFKEKDIPLDDIVFKVDSVVRNGRQVKRSSPVWFFYSKIYIIMPVRRVCRILCRVREKIKTRS